jgi:BCD family chlorophyll transporter-like MFS transporter
MLGSKHHIGLSFAKNLLPFSDAASTDLPLGQLLRLSLFQISVGMATVLLLGTLNRVMIVELGVPATIVALMVAIPVLIAPFRAALGFKSDNYRSAIGWKRIPFIWFGSLWQMGGLAIMPFALIVLSGDQTVGPLWAGEVLAGLAFLMTGIGLHMTQTAGLALASDRSPKDKRPRVVALLYVMFLVGMGLSALVIGYLLRDFSNLRLIRVVQGAALFGFIINLVAMWKQENVAPMSKPERVAPYPMFKDAWKDFINVSTNARLITVVFIGTLAFNMQDVLLEPYGGQVLKLNVSETTLLTVAWAAGALLGLGIAAQRLSKGIDPSNLMNFGVLVGFAAFSCVIFASAILSVILFFIGTFLIGLGAGLFSVSTLVAAMNLPLSGKSGRGLALGVWGAAQATGAGVAIAIGGATRDIVNAFALNDSFGVSLNNEATGYLFVYHIELVLLVVTLVILSPLIKSARNKEIKSNQKSARIGIADFPM